MRKNLLLVVGVIFAIMIINSSLRRIQQLRATSKNVDLAQAKLERLKSENEELKREFSYKNSSEFIEAEIRNKLGLAKENESIVILPREEEGKTAEDDGTQKPNWKKWQEVFFGT